MLLITKAFTYKLQKLGSLLFFLMSFWVSQAFILGLTPLPSHLPFPVLFHSQAKPKLF